MQTTQLKEGLIQKLSVAIQAQVAINPQAYVDLVTQQINEKELNDQYDDKIDFYKDLFVSETKNFFTISSKNSFSEYTNGTEIAPLIYTPLNNHSRSYMHRGDIVFCYRQGTFSPLDRALDTRGIYGIGIVASEPQLLFPERTGSDGPNVAEEQENSDEQDDQYKKYGVAIVFPFVLNIHLKVREIQLNPKTINLTPYNGNRNDSLQYIPSLNHVQTLLEMIARCNPAQKSEIEKITGKKIKDRPLPSEVWFGERNYHATSSNEASLQQIFFGAPGTGKSYNIKKYLNIIDGTADERKDRFIQSSFCKKNYDSYLNSAIPRILGRDVYGITDFDELKNAHKQLKTSSDVNASDYSSGLNSYISFVKKELLCVTFRTTFHPDYDHAQFVGAYKPRTNSIKSGDNGEQEKNEIVYNFVPQTFSKAYVAAWVEYLKAVTQYPDRKPKRVYLVIEEINRGNCAQIFGDNFQLLDRDKKGFSLYPVDADQDLAEWLYTKSELKDCVAYENAVDNGKLVLPPNLTIFATMNTSDQSLFPMDSAFKRRFDWKYVSINCSHPKADFDVVGANLSFKWLHFLKKINDDISKATESEDKQMGEFFIKPQNGMDITLDEFRSKVLFYLWDSVYKDDPSQNRFFHFEYPETNGSKVTFQKLFEKNDEFPNILRAMLKKLDDAYTSGPRILPVEDPLEGGNGDQNGGER